LGLLHYPGIGDRYVSHNPDTSEISSIAVAGHLIFGNKAEQKDVSETGR
jgi:hypothetical protein